MVSIGQRQVGTGPPSNGDKVLEQVVLADGSHAAGCCGLLQEAQIHLRSAQALSALQGKISGSSLGSKGYICLIHTRSWLCHHSDSIREAVHLCTYLVIHQDIMRMRYSPIMSQQGG